MHEQIWIIFENTMTINKSIQIIPSTWLNYDSTYHVLQIYFIYIYCICIVHISQCLNIITIIFTQLPFTTLNHACKHACACTTEHSECHMLVDDMPPINGRYIIPLISRKKKTLLALSANSVSLDIKNMFISNCQTKCLQKCIFIKKYKWYINP